MDAMGGRKFVLAMVVVAAASVLCWCAKIADGVFSAVVIATVGAYITGNVAQKKLGGAPSP